MLEQAHTRDEVKAAIQAAMRLGMPLSEIEQYLDSLDLLRSQLPRTAAPHSEPPATEPG
jgi:DNA-binding transcriptional MerR regulator